MRSTIKTFFTGLVAFGVFAMLPLAGCNTLEGAGEDVEDAGESVQDAAE